MDATITFCRCGKRIGRCIILVAVCPLIAGISVRGSELEFPDQLGIQEVVQLALGNHFTVAISEIELEQAEQLRSVRGEPFETTIGASVTAFRDSSTNPQDYPYSVEGVQQSMSVERQFSTGTSVQLKMETSAYENLGVDRSGETTLQVTQRLLEGRGSDYNLAPIRIADRQQELSREALRQTVIDTVTEAQFAYYDGILAESYLEVSKESLELAEQLMEENQTRAQIGSIASSDLLQAEAEVALRQDTLYQAEVGLKQAKNRMKRVLSDQTREILDWTFVFHPAHEPEKRDITLMQEYDSALALRPDYRQAVLSLEIGEIEQLRQSNLALPSADLYAQMSYEGWRDTISESFRKGFEDEKADFAVGISVSRSILNRSARANKLRATLENNRLRLTLRQLEQAILLDLDNAAAQIDANWKRLESAKRGRILAQRSLEAEQKRYKTGTSSTFILIRLQTDLINARTRELIAINDYRKSVVEFDRQTGKILELHHIDIP